MLIRRGLCVRGANDNAFKADDHFVEAHAEGEGGRVITGGLPLLPGGSVFE